MFKKGRGDWKITASNIDFTDKPAEYVAFTVREMQLKLDDWLDKDKPKPSDPQFGH